VNATGELIEPWRRAWRAGLAPLLGPRHLEALRDALLRDDPALIQGGTTLPPALRSTLDWPAEGACLIGYAGWKAGGLETVGEVDEFFTRVFQKASEPLGEPTACRALTNAYDEWPREEMIANLLFEVEREIALRGAAHVA
jgi:hypothetical protein